MIELDPCTRALSIRQPWAWLIAHNFKRLENRPKPLNRKGWIILHAGLKVDLGGYDFIADHFPPIFHLIPKSKDIHRGGIIGIGHLDGYLTSSASTWFFGPYGLIIDQAASVPFIPVAGALGLFKPKISSEQIAELRKHILLP